MSVTRLISHVLLSYCRSSVLNRALFSAKPTGEYHISPGVCPLPYFPAATVLPYPWRVVCASVDMSGAVVVSRAPHHPARTLC